VEFVVKEMFNSPSKLFTCDVVMDTNHQAHVITELELQVPNTIAMVTHSLFVLLFTALHHVMKWIEQCSML